MSLEQVAEFDREHGGNTVGYDEDDSAYKYNDYDNDDEDDEEYPNCFQGPPQ
jgi:hypothetical protein